MNKENDFCKLWDDVYVTNFHACTYDNFIFYSIIYCYITINPPFLSYFNVKLFQYKKLLFSK